MVNKLASKNRHRIDIKMTKIDTNHHEVTAFKSIRDTDTPFYRDARVLLARIKDGGSKDLVKQIRLEKVKEKRQDLKKGLPSICFSGTFHKRLDSALDQHSGLICLDFDGYPNKKGLLEEKERLTKNEFVFSVFISPSDEGLKALVRVPRDPDNHAKYFNSLETHFNSPYFDKTSKNISRVCYESYDPLIYINENSSVWDKIEEEKRVELTKNQALPTISITDENKIVEILVKWWEAKYPMVSGQRNHNTFILASAFNDFGIPKSLAEYVMRQYESQDFKANEIKKAIDSAYAQTANFGTKFYEDTEKMDSVRSKMRRGVSKKEVRNQLLDSEVPSDVVDHVINKIDGEEQDQKFWSKSDKGIVKIIHLIFKQFLEEHGFYKFCPEGSKNYVFVRVTNNLIDHTSDKEIKDFVLGHVIEMDDIAVYNYFAENTRYFKEEFLTLLDSIDVYFIADTKESAYLYYRNCAVMITKDEVTPIDYIDLGGYVWKEQIIDRNFTICDVIDCDYEQFVKNICAEDDSRVKSMESTIGFLLHGYKNPSYCPAVVLNDEVISDNPEGGTGKGLFMNGISKMKKFVIIDGKHFTFESGFPYQLVSADTQILCFDDVKKYFAFERLFSVVSEGITLEKKNKDAIKIPFEMSPKIAITTNYAIRGAGNSFERRKWELELHQYYDKDYTPYDEFGKLMFSGWNSDEWCQYDNYMVNNRKRFLKTGLVKSALVNLAIRKLSAETSHDFIEWCGLSKGSTRSSELKTNSTLFKQTLYNDFTGDFADYAPKGKMSISRTKFYKWLHAYGMFECGAAPSEGRDADGRWIIFEKKDAPKVEQQNLKFSE